MISRMEAHDLPRVASRRAPRSSGFAVTLPRQASCFFLSLKVNPFDLELVFPLSISAIRRRASLYEPTLTSGQDQYPKSGISQTPLSSSEERLEYDQIGDCPVLKSSVVNTNSILGRLFRPGYAARARFSECSVALPRENVYGWALNSITYSFR